MGISSIHSYARRQSDDDWLPWESHNQCRVHRCLVETYHIDIQSTGQKSPCARSTSELVVHCTEKPGGIPCSPSLGMHESSIHQEAFRWLALDSCKSQAQQGLLPQLIIPSPFSSASIENYARQQADDEALGCLERVTVSHRART